MHNRSEIRQYLIRCAYSTWDSLLEYYYSCESHTQNITDIAESLDTIPMLNDRYISWRWVYFNIYYFWRNYFNLERQIELFPDCIELDVRGARKFIAKYFKWLSKQICQQGAVISWSDVAGYFLGYEFDQI